MLIHYQSIKFSVMVKVFVGALIVCQDTVDLIITSESEEGFGVETPSILVMVTFLLKGESAELLGMPNA